MTTLLPHVWGTVKATLRIAHRALPAAALVTAWALLTGADVRLALDAGLLAGLLVTTFDGVADLLAPLLARMLGVKGGQ